MKVQDWLRNNNGNLELLEREYGIRTVSHSDGRTIFNYNQFDSPKFSPIVRDCRGLVLDSNNNWDLVARAFPRFFNWGENRTDMNKFIWKGSSATHKEDGSLILLYYWNGVWCANTRRSFGEGIIGGNDGFISWNGLISQTLTETFFNNADPRFTYVCELCSMYNKIVRNYAKPTIFLLTCYDCTIGDGMELSHDTVEEEAKKIKIRRPIHIFFEDIMDAQAYIAEQARLDRTFEGVVLRDSNDLRIKVKSSEYVALHRLANNNNPAALKNILPLILGGELDEIFTYFPEIQNDVYNVIFAMNEIKYDIQTVWDENKNIKSQKRFAHNIKSFKYNWILFYARKRKCHPFDLLDEETWLKILKGNK